MSAPSGYPQEFFHTSQPYGVQQQAHAGSQQQPGSGYSQQFNQQPNPVNQYSSQQQGSSYGGQPGHQQQGSYQSTPSSQHGMPASGTMGTSTSSASGMTKKLFSEGKKLVNQYRTGLKKPVNGHAVPAPHQQGANNQYNTQNPPYDMHQQQQQQYAQQQLAYGQQQQQQQYGQQQGGYGQQQHGTSGYPHTQGHNW